MAKITTKELKFAIRNFCSVSDKVGVIIEIYFNAERELNTERC